MTSARLIAILLITLPALALILYPLWRRRPAGDGAVGTAAAPDRTSELQEEKATVYRALREVEFDHEAGYLSEEDYRASRERYEARAARIIGALDALPRTPVEAGPREGSSRPAPGGAGPRRPRHTFALIAGIALLLCVGVAAGLLVGRPGKPESITTRASRPGPSEQASAPSKVEPAPSGTPLAPKESPGRDAVAGTIEAARQHLNQGRYKEAMAGYRAALQQDAGNVDALTHVGFILAIGGHADSALEAFDRIITSNPEYPLVYFYRGQVLYRARQDYAGAIRDWERYLALVPSGKEHDNVAAFLEAARAKQGR